MSYRDGNCNNCGKICKTLVCAGALVEKFLRRLHDQPEGINEEVNLDPHYSFRHSFIHENREEIENTLKKEIAELLQELITEDEKGNLDLARIQKTCKNVSQILRNLEQLERSIQTSEGTSEDVRNDLEKSIQDFLKSIL